MLVVLENPVEIDNAQRLFAGAFENGATDRVRASVGYRGGSEEHTLFWADNLGLWFCSRKIEGSRYWNAFGIGKPAEGSNIPIVCEVNFPLNGMNRNVGGVFARDGNGRIFVLHRGNIGGGRRGIGKTLFEEKYQGRRLDVEDGEKVANLALIGAIESADFVRQAKYFVETVRTIKSGFATDSSVGKKPTDEPEYNREFAGKKRYLLPGSVEASCNHGLVVDGLQQSLEDSGYKVGNDRNRDLYIVDSCNNIIVLFEVKTSISTGDVYTGLGQLYLNSISLAECKTLVLVTPESPPEVVRKRLRLLRIQSLTYELKGKNVSFGGLSDLILKCSKSKSLRF